MSTSSRRDALKLGSICLLGGTAGCLGGFGRLSSSEEDGYRSNQQSWPQFQKNGGNVGRTNVLVADRRYSSVRWQSRHRSSSGGYGGVGDPIVHDGLLYVGEFEKDEYRIVALDTEDATRLWSRSLSGRNATPAVASGKLVVPTTNVVETNRVSAFDATEGSEQWHFDFDGGSVTAITHQDGRFFVAQEASFDGTHPARVFAIAKDGTELWRKAVKGSIEAPVAVGDVKVFVGTTTGQLNALNVETGESVWTRQTEGEIRCAPSVNGGTVFVADEIGSVYSFSTSGSKQWRGSASPPAPGAGLAITTDSVYVGGEKGLHALAREDGSLRWSVEEDKRVTTPAIGSGTVYFGTDEALVAVDIESGEPHWSRGISSVTEGDTIIQGVLTAPAITEDGLYVGTSQGLYAFTTDT